MGKVFRWTAGGAAALVAVAIAVPFFVPVAHFIPRVTAAASSALGQPVAIADLQLRLLPTPRVIAKGLRIGERDEARAEELEIVPDLLSLLMGPRTLRLVRLEKVDLKEPALGFAASMPKRGGPSEPLEVRRIVLKHVRLEHPALKLPPFDLEAELAEGSRLQEARLEIQDGVLRLAMEPEGEKALRLTLEGRLYGGSVSAAARADWTKQWQVSGKASLGGVDLVPVQRLFGKPGRLSGRLRTDGSFTARARTPDQLADALAWDGPFEVLGGAYRGIDLGKAADLGAQPAAGDATQFEELKGKLQVRGKRVRVEELCVRSPRIVAGGHVEIAPDQKLSGRLEVSFAKTRGLVGVPLALDGTAADPSVTPTKGYVIGAVVGTVLLPGIGTGLGASAGSALEGGSSGCQ